MKILNKKFKMALIFISLFTVILNSCKKEEDEEIAKPVIKDFELGYNDSGIAVLGGDLHIEAAIVAEGKVQKIEVHIHGHGWHFDKEYTTKYAGVVNPTFHEHIDIPLDIDTGTYHFHFKVIDMEGQIAELARDLIITEPSDETPPNISVTSAPADNEVFTTGQTITIEGNITDDVAIGGVYIGLVNVNQALSNQEVNASNTITLLHTHTFSDPKNFSFNASLEVGAAEDNNITPKPISWESGDFYILVKSRSAFGNNWAFSQHYPIIINL